MARTNFQGGGILDAAKRDGLIELTLRAEEAGQVRIFIKAANCVSQHRLVVRVGLNFGNVPLARCVHSGFLDFLAHIVGACFQRTSLLWRGHSHRLDLQMKVYCGNCQRGV